MPYKRKFELRCICIIMLWFAMDMIIDLVINWYMQMMFYWSISWVKYVVFILCSLMLETLIVRSDESYMIVMLFYEYVGMTHFST